MRGRPPARPPDADDGDREPSRGGGDPRRSLPAVDALLGRPEVEEWSARWGGEAVKAAIRAALGEARERLARPADGGGPGTDGGAPRPAAGEPEALLADARRRLEGAALPSLRRVLNATGVVLHTNLGRAPLAGEALDALRVAAGYSNLEYELDAGRRGSRYDHCAARLREMGGSEAALVVNNNAAAVALAVNELAAGAEVVVSRGELVEIGGSFRIPEVVARAGATLREVGTTNRTRPEDYRRALGPRVRAILKVHPSNYRVEGFVESVPLEALVALGREAGIPVVHDLGSGLLRPELLGGFPEEPPVRASVAAGADLVTWSGDKLLGGPQAGIVLGTAEMVGRLRRNPLLRAFRVDKLTLAALEATLILYRDPAKAAARIPALRMLREPVESVERRARRALEDLRAAAPATVELRRMDALVGGGSFPAHRIPSAGWAVTGPPPEAVERACREADPALVGRIEEDAFLLDFRTLLPGEEAEASAVLEDALAAVRDR